MRIPAKGLEELSRAGPWRRARVLTDFRGEEIREGANPRLQH